MQQDTTSIKTTAVKKLDSDEISLAILHIGMMLAAWDAEGELLPLDLLEVNTRIFEIFGVDMGKESDIGTARNKIVAIIQQLQREETLQ